MRAERTDVVVIGAGHNGLTAACYLARAGLGVVVVEAGARIGGCTSTAAMIPHAPEHLISPCAADIVTLHASDVVEDLGLRKYGWDEVYVDPGFAHLDPDGGSLTFWRDPTRTAEEIRRFSSADARAFLDLVEDLDPALDVLLALMNANPCRPRPRQLLAAVKAIARHPRRVSILGKLAAASAAEAIDARFSHPIVRGAIAVQANLAAPITGDGTASSLAVLALMPRLGQSHPVGGTQALPDALAACLAEHGGTVRVASPVVEVLVDGARACGVRLQDGEAITASRVLAACDPHKALNQLLPDGALSPAHRARVRAIPTSNDHCAHLKVDVALSGRLDLSRHQRERADDTDLRLPGLTFGSLEQLCDAIRDAQAGRLAATLPFVGMIPTAADATQAPDGQDTLYLWAGWVPPEPAEGWPALSKRAGERLLDAGRSVIDGIDELTIGTQIETPEDLEARTGLTSGNPYQVDLTPMRLGPLRPALGFGGYRTPLAGFFITGGGTHPGPSVSGIPGRLAADEILRTIRSERRRVFR